MASSQLMLLNNKDAIENFTKYIVYVQDEENAYLNRGNAKFKVGDYVGSINDYEKFSLSIKNHISH